jgi:hypothetical protein
VSLLPVRRGSPDPAEGLTAGLQVNSELCLGIETFGHPGVAVGRPPHNRGQVGVTLFGAGLLTPPEG